MASLSPDAAQTASWRSLVAGELPDDEAEAVRSALAGVSLAAPARRDAASDGFQADPSASRRDEMVAANRRYWACSVVYYALADDSELALLGVVAVERLARFHPDDWEGHFEQEDAVIAAPRRDG